MQSSEPPFNRAAPVRHFLLSRGAPPLFTARLAAPLAGFFDPAALNPPALLEAIQQRVERGDAKLEDSLRARLNELAEVVAMPRLILDEREDQQLGAALFQLPIQHLRLDVLHSDILLKGM